MGQVTSRINDILRRNQEGGQVNEDDDPERQLSFPSTAGSYFGSHFLMCGGRFDLAKPEAFLFGENSDLDLLGSRAVPFPYASPLGSNEVHPLNLLVNIRKESVKFVRVKGENGEYAPNLFQLEFTLDAECPCFVQIHVNAREFYHEGEIQFAYRNKRSFHSEQYHFDIGCDQTFSNYVFDLSQWDLDDLHYSGGHYFPLVIMLQTDGVERAQTQTTMCSIEPSSDAGNTVILKPLRQKIACDGVVYLLQEIFGIENKEQSADMGDEGGLECIICMSDVRDTVILPCRHLCICNNCADTLRYKLNNCPICRSPFRALIHLRARRQTKNQGFETVTLVEGLNGPLNHQLSIDRDVIVEEQEIVAETDTPQKKVHSRSLSRTSCTVTQQLSSDDDDFVESAEGIQMKRYIPKEIQVVAHDETPVLSNVSSRSQSPMEGYDTPDESEKEVHSTRRQALQPGSGQSSNGLLDECSAAHDNPTLEDEEE